MRLDKSPWLVPALEPFAHLSELIPFSLSLPGFMSWERISIYR